MAFAAQTPYTVEPAPTWLERSVEALARVWQSFWERRAQRATIALLQSLDQQTLRDIGINRSEIESVVYGPPIERRRIYREGGCW
jgi:uncharacterized protein YjiS (DUF1127 family)